MNTDAPQFPSELETVAEPNRVIGDMRAHPAKWIGIAAGAGFGIGMLGRYVRWRSSKERVPQTVVL